MAIDLFEAEVARNTMRDIMLVLVAGLRKRLRLQGHFHSGRLFKSIKFEIDLEKDAIIGEIKFSFYGQYVETGVPAASIPFGGSAIRSRRGGGGVSQYIQALKRYFEEKGFRANKALSIAFATARVHKREGMPTRSSGRFSGDEGRARTGFVGRTVKEKQPLINGFVSAKLGEGIASRITSSFLIASGEGLVQDIRL